MRSLITRVKEYDYESKEMQSQILAVQNAYDEKAEDMGGQRQVKRIKEGLRSLKQQVREEKFEEGLMVNSIFTFKNKMSHKGKNHLYDNIEEEGIPQETEFTEADLAQP